MTTVGTATTIMKMQQNYGGGINESHLTLGHIRQAKPPPRKHKPKSGKKAYTQHHGTITATAIAAATAEATENW